MENEKLQTNAFIAPQPETQSATSSTNTNAKVEEVKAFLKDDL
jgi:hypothetical protein